LSVSQAGIQLFQNWCVSVLTSYNMLNCPPQPACVHLQFASPQLYPDLGINGSASAPPRALILTPVAPALRENLRVSQSGSFSLRPNAGMDRGKSMNSRPWDSQRSVGSLSHIQLAAIRCGTDSRYEHATSLVFWITRQTCAECNPQDQVSQVVSKTECC
jgi:hypothetical protein